MDTQKRPRRRYQSRSPGDQNLKKKASVISALREFCLYFHQPRKQAKEAAKIKIPMKKKDGTLGASYTVAWQCAHCDGVTTKPQMDHKIPIGQEPDYPYDVEELLQYMRRLLAPLEQWQCLCAECHKKKTGKERYGR